MKKLLCYVGIIIIIAFIAFPPVLRIVLPDEEKKEIHIEIERSLLYCSSNEFLAISNYEGDDVKLINLKKMSMEEDYEYTTGEELLNTFDSIKNTGDTVYNELDDGELISIDFSVSNHKDMEISNLTNSLTNEKEYYESQGLVCEIRK